MTSCMEQKPKNPGGQNSEGMLTPLTFVAHILIKLRLKIPELHDLSKLYA